MISNDAWVEPARRELFALTNWSVLATNVDGVMNTDSTAVAHGRRTMSQSLEQLLEAARRVQMSQEQQEEQRRSFAFGNTAFENPRITRAMVDEEAEKLKTR